LGSGRYDVVEYLSVEEYLYGVLPREVETTWPLDALKAQAVVSRTYVLYNKMKGANERYDVLDSVLDQVYGGQNVEAPSTTQAVNETHDEILLDSAGKPVQAFFHSSCGGHTELPEHVWKSSYPSDVFGVVSDGSYCSDDPHYKWQLSVPYTTLRARLKRAGFQIRDIKSISILQKSASGRAETFILETSKTQIEVAGNRFRLALGPEALRSTLLVNMKAGKKSVFFEGRGWGHGVGLCQWGARGRALAGQTYKQILQTYYPKAKLATQTL
jgi:stage II sporulation protein D